jgi:hypothetical protein
MVWKGQPMRCIAAALLLIASTACATPKVNQPGIAQRLDAERQKERVERMQQEFNTLFPDG